METRHPAPRKTATPQAPPWGSPPRRRRAYRRCSPFPTTTAKNAGAAFWAAGLESTFLSSALRFLAPSSAFASLSLTSMTPQRSSCSTIRTGRRSSAWGALERGPSSACTGLSSLAQARPKAQGLQANHPCNTSGQRHPAKLRHSQCSFYAILDVGFTPFSM